MSKKPNTKTITNAAAKAHAEAAPGSFEKVVILYQTGPKLGLTVSMNGTSLVDSHTAAFIKWKKNKQA